MSSNGTQNKAALLRSRRVRPGQKRKIVRAQARAAREASTAKVCLLGGAGLGRDLAEVDFDGRGGMGVEESLAAGAA